MKVAQHAAQTLQDSVIPLDPGFDTAHSKRLCIVVAETSILML